MERSTSGSPGRIAGVRVCERKIEPELVIGDGEVRKTVEGLPTL